MSLWWKEKGQASLVLVLIVGLVAMMVTLTSGTLSTTNVQIEDSVHTADQAWFAAWAGVDELMYRLRSRQNFGSSFQLQMTLDNGATVSATITGDNNSRTVRSEGFMGDSRKRVEVKVVPSSSKGSFAFAIQAGEGGFELLNNSYVTGVGGGDGNVYSNGDIKGISTSSTNGSRILGNVWAVGYVGGLTSPSSGGVYVKKNAAASALRACKIDGNANAPIPPSNCTVKGSFSLSNSPEPAPLVDMDVDYWKGVAESGGIWQGNCGLGGGGGDCTGGTRRLGNIKIQGNLSIHNNQTITLTGPVWVVGDINISNNVIVNVDNSLGPNSVIVIASDPVNPPVKGKIMVSNNVDFNRNSSGAGIIFLSENSSDVCADPAVSVDNNTDTVIFVANQGCVFIDNNAVVIGVVGKKIHLENNSIVRNDPSLFSKLVLVGGGGWSVVSITEY